MQRDHDRLLNRVRQLEREGSERSVRGVSSGQRACCSGGSPRGPRPCPVFRGSGTEEAPYILVEIEDKAVVGPSRRLSSLGVEEQVTQAKALADRDPVPPYEE